MTESKKTTRKNTARSKATKKIVQIEDIIKCDNIENRFLHVKVGDASHPASDEDIASTQAQITELLEDNNIKCLVYVSHHGIDIQVVK